MNTEQKKKGSFLKDLGGVFLCTLGFIFVMQLIKALVSVM